MLRQKSSSQQRGCVTLLNGTCTNVVSGWETLQVSRPVWRNDILQKKVSAFLCSDAGWSVAELAQRAAAAEGAERPWAVRRRGCAQHVVSAVLSCQSCHSVGSCMSSG